MPGMPQGELPKALAVARQDLELTQQESITMDPFMYLTVPLPIAQYREFKYHFVPRDPEKPTMRGKVLVPANASFTQVKEKLGILMKCSPQHVSSAST